MQSMLTRLGGGIMKRITALFLASALLIPLSSNAEILALLNYESKPNDSLKDLKMPFGTQARKEGIAIINLPGMNDGSVSIVDMRKREVIGSMDSLKDDDFNPNCIVLLAEWNDLAGH